MLYNIWIHFFIYNLIVLKLGIFDTIYSDPGSPPTTHPRYLSPPHPHKSTPFLCIISKTQKKAELGRWSIDLL